MSVPTDEPPNLMDTHAQLPVWALWWLASPASALLWAPPLRGVLHGGIFVGSVLLLSRFSENLRLQVAQCYVFHTLGGTMVSA